MFRYTRLTFARELLLLAGALIWCIPVYLLFTLSLKSDSDAISSPYSLPAKPTTSNFSTVWENSPFPGFARAMINSTIITGGTVTVLIVFGSLAAYVLGRHQGKLSSALYFAFVLGYILPLQLAIIPIFSAMRKASLTGTWYGAVILYSGLLMPLAVFLYTGFVRTLPRSYEEAAQVDGASPFVAFRKIVFPLLRPVTVTVALVAGVTVWNDFFVSLIFLSGSHATTLPAMLYGTVGEYTSRYNLTFAAILLAVLPIIVFFLFAQKHLMRGFAVGLR
jgi:raffinose/stachyose/melibiose transport system permease protein